MSRVVSWQGIYPIKKVAHRMWIYPLHPL